MMNLMGLKDKIKETVTKGTDSVEKFHKSIAKMPFEVLEKIEPLKDVTKSVKEIHDKTVDTVYDTVRKVNEKA
ncbi:MAG: hypothetical protein HQK75_02155 [Candidatus Magnetomorum sp.]|nr:hypothetical protein [Candidatus Magnetomorum sp.]